MTGFVCNVKFDKKSENFRFRYFVVFDETIKSTQRLLTELILIFREQYNIMDHYHFGFLIDSDYLRSRVCL